MQGNYDPSKRLGLLHEESCGGPPGWGPSSDHHAFRTWLAIVPCPAVIEWVSAPGTLSHAQSLAFARREGARLPSKAELTTHIAQRGGGILFEQDIWAPVSNHENAWVSVVRLFSIHPKLIFLNFFKF